MLLLLVLFFLRSEIIICVHESKLEYKGKIEKFPFQVREVP
jgi:hypothetical protein